MSVLEQIVEHTREGVARRRREVPLASLEPAVAGREDRPFAEALAQPGISLVAEHKRRSPSAGPIRDDLSLEPAVAGREDRPFAEALAQPGISLVAEHKRRSPSAGPIREDLSLEDVVGAYERGGAAAVSILTADHFGGSLDDLRAARAATALPLLRKDFFVDPYQLYESAAAGADAVLLIVAALHPDDLQALFDEALALDLDVLVEVHEGEELETALAVGADVVGINNRDLSDFSVDLDRTFDLLADVPAGKTVVSESGFDRREQLDELERVGVDAVLIGEALMRAGDIEAACRALTAAPGADPEP